MKRRRPGDKLRMSLLMLLVFLTLTGCSSGTQEPGRNTDAGQAEQTGLPELKVTFFDVGKGDAILLETETQTMLIDTGYDDTADVILDYLRAEQIESLDYLVITHFDKDHVGGADKVLEAVEVEHVLQPDYESDSKQSREYQEALAQQEITAERITDTKTLALEESQCVVYPPRKAEYEEEDNDFSLVISLTHGQERFLFAGDCEKERLSELLAETELDLKHQVLKVPHHGREEKNSDKFLLAVSPEAAVITCSEDKEPDREILEILEGLGAEIYLTSEGTVTCVTDGERLEFQQE